VSALPEVQTFAFVRPSNPGTAPFL
jgi:hypothetical protein